jgi:hypothetical protein
MNSSGESHPTNDTACTTRACGGRWKLLVLFALVLAAIVAYRVLGTGETQVGGPGATTNDTTPPSRTGETVSLTFRFGESDERKLEPIGWHQGMTVDDLMTAASRAPDGIRYAMRGAGEMAFLTRIDDVANEGASGRNWTYTVNGARADKSFAVYELQPGDHVLWTFAAGE